MSYLTIRAGLKSLLLTIPDIGIVHNRRRWSNNWASLLEQFQYEPTDGSDPHFRGWMITRTDYKDEDSDSAYGKTYRYNAFVIYGIMAFEDADGDETGGDTEGKFQDLIDTVVAAIDNNVDNLSGADLTVIQGLGVVGVSNIDLRDFGGVLCHYCEVQVVYPTEL